MSKRLSISYLTGRRGFTLTEILLAVMIVGLIGVALASLTRASARESGVGRSRIMLRNNLSNFVRILRKDLASATKVPILSNTAIYSTSSGNYHTLLHILQNASQKKSTETPESLTGQTGKMVSYCFKVGSDTTNILPSGAIRGGSIYRVETNTLSASYPECNATNCTSNNLVLQNVKYISANTLVNGSQYPVPLFFMDHLSYWLLKVNLIVELNTNPIVNETIELSFDVPGV